MELRPIAGVAWARKRHPKRVRATYHKKAGTEQFLGFYDDHGDVLEGVIRRRKTPRDLLQTWQRLRASYPRKSAFTLFRTISASAAIHHSGALHVNTDVFELAQSDRGTVYGPKELLSVQLRRSDPQGTERQDLQIPQRKKPRAGQATLPSLYL